nr:hypothetical protein [Paracoccus saliphilus]
MHLFSRMILVLLLAVFAAGSVVHTAAATTMAVDMAMVEMTDMDAASMGSAECEVCVDEIGAGSTICDLVCSSGGFAAVAASDPLELKPTLYDLRQHFSDVKLSGVGNLPLRDPPRPFL